MKPPKLTIDEVLKRFGLTLEGVKVACEPQLPDHRVVVQPTTDGYGNFFAHVFYLTTDPNARQAPGEGWVASFILEIEQIDTAIPASVQNCKARVDEWIICGNEPYPEFFKPILGNIQTALSTLHICHPHIPLGTQTFA